MLFTLQGRGAYKDSPTHRTHNTYQIIRSTGRYTFPEMFQWQLINTNKFLGKYLFSVQDEGTFYHNGDWRKRGQLEILTLFTA